MAIDLAELKEDYYGFGKGTHATFRERYRAYLDSPAWEHKRRLVYERAEGRCERCGRDCSGIAWHVHHLNYRRVFRERLEDLELLDHFCHSLEHDLPCYPTDR